MENSTSTALHRVTIIQVLVIEGFDVRDTFFCLEIGCDGLVVGPHLFEYLGFGGAVVSI